MEVQAYGTISEPVVFYINIAEVESANSYAKIEINEATSIHHQQRRPHPHL